MARYAQFVEFITHEELLKLAAAEPKIEFCGPYPNSEVGRVLRGLDVIVVPSICYEVGPTVIAEALVNNVPAVASRLGEIPEFIDHGQNGLLFEAGRVDDLVAQMQRLLQEPSLLQRLRSGIQPMPTVAEEMTQLAALYESIL